MHHFCWNDGSQDNELMLQARTLATDYLDDRVEKLQEHLRSSEAERPKLVELMHPRLQSQMLKLRR